MKTTKNNIFAITAAIAVTACNLSAEPANDTQKPFTQHTQNITIDYPATKQDNVVDEYFGVKVSDPYRWLEDDQSIETAEWVTSQNQVTSDYLNQIPYRQEITDRLSNLINFDRVAPPFKEGKYTYVYKISGLQNQSVLYRQIGDNEQEVFLDPNTLSDDGTTAITDVKFSEDGSFVSYQISEGGRDWNKVVVLNAETKEQVGETLVNVKLTQISWLHNEGFYYSRFDKPEGSELTAKTEHHKLYFHKVGTKQSEDTLIFGGTDAEKHQSVSGYTTKDYRYLIISTTNSNQGNKLFLKDLSKPNSDLITILDTEESRTKVIHNDGSILYLETDIDAPNRRVVSVSADAPLPANWKEVIPETQHPLTASTVGNFLFASYTINAASKVMQYDMQGKLIRQVELPGIGTAVGFSGKQEKPGVLRYTFTDIKTPNQIYSLNLESGESTLYRGSKSPFESDAYESRKVFYSSKDGTQVPMLITYKKGTPMDGTTPTILYGYGGFGRTEKPFYLAEKAVWLEMGGIYAIAYIRGGGEYGKTWHKAATQLQKQNSFDDFIAAAEYLIEEGYTSSNKLAINGSSNGGLLVGAVAMQRPELFQVALPEVGVFDMLRYTNFTVSNGWMQEYGVADQSQEMFQYLSGYSPLHNVKPGTKYPATLIMTGDGDDRVVPSHSYKFAAELQSKQVGSHPILLRMGKNTGHGYFQPTGKRIEKYVDMYSFTLFNMGVTEL
ncbi:S9 family peptidase [Vibrio sp. S9_S30]|uniref:prolyl oligopeptidase family serine peptidase n=1 Tax=Vibrio sp. S9_S30 TaxID=2720226 RepID=UPI001681A003|nr:prolyl oligopeptidase family serine peptidase [Vibrio sp. S9_S30]MBD1556333.1 S9 family peptidase [Vibrio sp. S9_S30]